MSIPTRIDEELYEAAKVKGAVNSRSAAQQIAHWAKLGRAVESSSNVTQRQIEAVLSGELTYDDASEAAQEAVHAEWMSQIPHRMSQLNFAEEFVSAGESSWTVGDSEGSTAERTPADYQQTSASSAT